MAGVIALILNALWLMLPAYIANMGAVFVGGGPPIDGGRRWRDGRRVLGDGKTWRGLLLAPVVAVAATGILRALAPLPPLAPLGLSTFGPAPWWPFLAYALGFGALFGDAVASFVKRRRGLTRGERWLGPDQLDFVLGAWLWAFAAASALDLAGATEGNWFLQRFTAPVVVTLLILTPFLHLAVNYIGWKIGKKDVPW